VKRPTRGARLIAILILAAAISACDEPTDLGEFGCDPCGWILLQLTAEPFSAAAGGIFHVRTRSTIPGYGSALGIRELSHPGEYRVDAGIPWGSPAPAGDTLLIWVVADWHDAPRNEAFVDRDSTLVLARYEPRAQAPPEDTAVIVLHR
jgi:hypothetical protein